MSAAEHEQLDATNSLINVIETGDEAEVEMILGHKERIRCAGIVRPGVKVPKNSCTAAEKAKFKELEAQGQGYDSIDVALGGKPKSASSKLFPSNSDFFVVRDCDFKKPADAQYIRQHYSDPDGHVRRIPVWFTLGEIDRVLPHNYKAFDGSGSVRCASFYDGKQLKFRYLPKGVQNPKAEDWKILDADDEDAAGKACGYKVTFGGMYRVNVVGLRGLEEVIIPTKSWHGIGYSVAMLRRVRSILGRFDGLVNGQPIFELCKVQEEVTTPDGKKQNQWLVVLELSIDPIELARYAEPQAVAARASRAMQMLTGGETVKAPTPAPLPLQQAVALTPADKDLPAGLGEAAADLTLPPQGEGTTSAGGGLTRQQKGVQALVDLAAPHGLTVKDLDNLAASTYQGVAVNDLELSQLENFYRVVQANLRENREGFVADVKALSA